MTMPHPLRLDDQLNVVLDAARNRSLSPQLCWGD